MTRFKNSTRGNWLMILVPTAVMVVAVLALGLQAFTAPSVSDIPSVPQGTALGTATKSAPVSGPAYSEVVSMGDWQNTAPPPPPPPVSGHNPL